MSILSCKEKWHNSSLKRRDKARLTINTSPTSIRQKRRPDSHILFLNADRRVFSAKISSQKFVTRSTMAKNGKPRPTIEATINNMCIMECSLCIGNRRKNIGVTAEGV